MHTIILAALCALLFVAVGMLLKQWASGFRAPILRLANLGVETHDSGRITKKADAALATRYLLVKVGSDVDHIAVAGAADIPLGVALDEPAAAEDLCAVQLLGTAGRTIPMVASAAITLDDFVVAAANGKIRTLPGTTGTYYIIGRALKAAAADGDLIEIDPCFPIQRVVA